MNLKYVALVFFFLCLCFTSCSKYNESDSVADFGGSAFLVFGNQWIVVKEPVAAMYEAPGYENIVLNHARRGDFFEVRGKRFVTEVGEDGTHRVVVWYSCGERGWIIESSVTVYNNRMQAEHASTIVSSQ